MKRVAFVIAVEFAPHEHSQIAFADRLRAFYAERSGAGRPAIYQYEPHVAPPGAKQYTVSVELLTLGRRSAQMVSAIAIVPIPLHFLRWNKRDCRAYAKLNRTFRGAPDPVEDGWRAA